MRKLLAPLFVLLPVLTLHTLAGAQRLRTILPLDVGSTPSWAFAINERGDIVGVSGFQTEAMQAFLSSPKGVFTPLPPLPGDVRSVAHDINNRGQIVGASQAADGTSQPVIWERGSVIPLGFLPEQVSGEALDINDRGDVVGAVQLSDPLFGEQRAFIWTHGVISDFGSAFVLASRGFSSAQGINNRGQIVGQVADGAYLWDKGELTLLGTLGGVNGNAHAINERGQIVGDSQTASGDFHGFLWQKGTMHDLGTLPGGRNSIALGLNDRGDVVGQGEVDPFTGESHAFLWRRGVMADLGVLVFNFSRAEAINNRGDIVGLAFDENEHRAVLWTLKPR